MSCSKPLPPFVCDSLYYLNRNQLERFSFVCRPLKNFIDRYLHSKPYRVFDELRIRGDSYALIHNNVRWHPKRDDYSSQQFLAGESHHRVEYYSLAEMRPYLGQTVRIEKTFIYVTGSAPYNSEHIEQIESIAHLWSDRKITVWNLYSRIDAEDFQLILNSPTILKCQFLFLHRAHFSFKDYKVLYNTKMVENTYRGDNTDPDYWPQFIEQPGAKPLVVLRGLCCESINTVVYHLSKTFSSAVSRNAFKIVFAQNRKPLTEFRKTNETSGEKLELKKGLPTDCNEPGTVYAREDCLKCRPTCENPQGSANCTLDVCAMGCVCSEGHTRYPLYNPAIRFVRKCIPLADCPKCSPNEVYDHRMRVCNGCERTCERHGRFLRCTAKACTYDCTCANGFVRNRETNKCIRLEECDRPTIGH